MAASSRQSVFAEVAGRLREGLNHRLLQQDSADQSNKRKAQEQQKLEQEGLGDGDDDDDEDDNDGSEDSSGRRGDKSQSAPSSSNADSLGIMLESSQDGVGRPLYRVLHLARPQWMYYQECMRQLGYHAKDAWHEGTVVSPKKPNRQRHTPMCFKPFGVISPRSMFAHFWLSFIMICDLTYAAFLIPVAVAFCTPVPGRIDWCQMTEVVFGTVYLANLYFGFSIGFVLVSGHKHLRLCHRRLVARVYILHGSFWSDCLTLIPWLYMILLAVDKLPASHVLNYTRILLALRMLRVIPMVKQLLVNAYSNPTSSYMPTTSAASLYAMTVAYVAALVVNFYACLVFVVAKYEHFGKSWIQRYDFAFSSTPPVPSVTEKGDLRKYILSVYWIITTITTVGYGDLVPVSWPEQIIMVLVMLTGATVFGILVGSISEALDQASARYRRSQLLRTKLADVRGWLRRRQVGEDLRRDILAWYSFSWQQHQDLSLEGAILAGLPHTLRYNMLCYITRPLLSKIPLFGLSLIHDAGATHAHEMCTAKMAAGWRERLKGRIASCFGHSSNQSQQLPNNTDGSVPALCKAQDPVFVDRVVKQQSMSDYWAFHGRLAKSNSAANHPQGTSQEDATVLIVDSHGHGSIHQPSSPDPVAGDDSAGSAWRVLRRTWQQLKSLSTFGTATPRPDVSEEVPVTMGKDTEVQGERDADIDDTRTDERSKGASLAAGQSQHRKSEGPGTSRPSWNPLRHSYTGKTDLETAVGPAKQLHDKWFALLSSVMQPMQAVPLQNICVEGALCDRFWILEDGEVHVIKHARARYRKGERERETWVGVTDPAEETQRTTLRATRSRPLVLGHGAFLRLWVPECMYSLQTIRAKTFSQLWFVKMDHFRPILKRNPDFEECIMENLKLEMVAHLRLSRAPERPWVDMCFFLERALKPDLRIKLARRLSDQSWERNRRQMLVYIRCLVRASWKKNVQPVEDLIKSRSTLEYQPSFSQSQNMVLRTRAMTVSALDTDTLAMLEKYRQKPGDEYTEVSPRSSTDGSPNRRSADSPRAGGRDRDGNGSRRTSSARAFRRNSLGPGGRQLSQGAGGALQKASLRDYLREAAQLDAAGASPRPSVVPPPFQDSADTMQRSPSKPPSGPAYRSGDGSVHGSHGRPAHGSHGSQEARLASRSLRSDRTEQYATHEQTERVMGLGLRHCRSDAQIMSTIGAADVGAPQAEDTDTISDTARQPGSSQQASEPGWVDRERDESWAGGDKDRRQGEAVVGGLIGDGGMVGGGCGAEAGAEAELAAGSPADVGEETGGRSSDREAGRGKRGIGYEMDELGTVGGSDDRRQAGGQVARSSHQGSRNADMTAGLVGIGHVSKGSSSDSRPVRSGRADRDLHSSTVPVSTSRAGQHGPDVVHKEEGEVLDSFDRPAGSAPQSDLTSSYTSSSSLSLRHPSPSDAPSHRTSSSRLCPQKPATNDANRGAAAGEGAGLEENCSGKEYADSGGVSEACSRSVKSHTSGLSDTSAKRGGPRKVKFRIQRKITLKPMRCRKPGSAEREDAKVGPAQQQSPSNH